MLVGILTYLAFAAVLVKSHECNWSASSESAPSRVVRPVYLGCREGKVSWSYPQGALRIVLQLPPTSSERGQEFRVCLRPEPNFSGAAIFLEGRRSLVKLYTPQEAGKSLVRCFLSRNERAAIYVEAIEPVASAVNKHVASFLYDLQPIPKGKLYDPYEECRPCTSEEMTHAFCTSELVVRGTIMRVTEIDETDMSLMTLKVSRTLRELNDEIESAAAFRSNSARYGGVSVYGNAIANDEDDPEPGTVSVHIGTHCEAGHGPGEVVLMARRKLGQLVIQCAPRAEEWSNIIKGSADTAHCLLSV